jgi:hypothetical protein
MLNAPPCYVMSERDGSRDFDPLLGRWQFHLRRLIHPLTGSNDWVEFEGTSKCISIWNGRGQLDEIVVVSPSDGSKIEGLAIRLYNPKTREWSIYYAGSGNPAFGTPQKGKFVDGRGEFLDRDIVNGKNVIVRYLWTDLDTDTPRFEQAFSTDEGQTWETNWITSQERTGSESDTQGGNEPLDMYDQEDGETSARVNEVDRMPDRADEEVDKKID